MSLSQPQGFLTLPKNGNGRGVLVLHAWWGLNDTIKAFCTHLAESGFIAFAPDLYHGRLATTIAEAEALGSALDANFQQAKAEIAWATHFLAEKTSIESTHLAVVGFSLGAYYALDLSNADPAHIRSVVVFYGSGAEEFSNAKADYLGHFAENDPYEPSENVDFLEEVLKRAERPFTFYRYPGTGHWFFEPDRKDAFNPEASRLAWERTLAFLNRPLTE